MSEFVKGENAEAPMVEATEEFFHPETGEKMSKNAWKKLQKGGGKEKKEKKEMPKPSGKPKEKKEKKVEEVFVDKTPSGDFKDLSQFPPAYQPAFVESAWQSWWEKEGMYRPDMTAASNASQDEKFVMVIPPPNVTGSLHLGHALTNAVEDTLTRWHRMNGKVTLWVPGTDHAGIATQSVVEKRLKKEENLSRHDLGREPFVKKVWEWKETYGNKITGQIRSLGASCDWERESFTMDSNLSKAVTEAFCRFHEDNLLYRDTRLVNWSCALRSAISDIEVDHIDIEEKTFRTVPGHDPTKKYEFGMITSFAYKVEGSDEEIVVATTRLETMLGDTGVAVHPEDPRYKHLHGKMLIHPFVDRKIPIITDPISVDMSFGTGAVKITPAHDPNDYLCGKRNNLEFIVCVSEDGSISANGGQYAGMMRYDVRQKMEKDLEALGLYRGKALNKMRLGICSRSGDIIEPMLTPQWYVNCNSMAKRAVDSVRNGDLKIVPAMHEDTWYYWLDNIRDWCVSRQLWWGHRIPAYFVRIAGEANLDKNEPGNNDRWVVARSEAEAKTKAAEKFNVSENEITLEQDEDVLDTWFSSGLFPFSVFGWPNQTEDFNAFYPTTLLETGADILFFWVARMVMMGLHLTDKLPFTTVYLHAMVRDKNGKKMSKSLGNVIDPLEVIHGCSLDTLLQKITDGNLPAKEVSILC
jgi:valyl-tRNA synthetase